MNAEKASQLNKEHWLGDFFCGAFDVAVIGDTCPDGRFLMKRIDESPDLGEPESDKKKGECVSSSPFSLSSFDIYLSLSLSARFSLWFKTTRHSSYK